MSAPRIVLVRPSHPGNIGAVARAMKVMGLSSLYLVSPRKFPHEEASALAVHAQDILENAVLVAEVVEALEGITFVCATSAQVRDEALPVWNVREGIREIQQKTMHRSAILFGPENYGLSHEDLLYAHALIRIPTASVYHSLNLAAAVQVIAYEYYSLQQEYQTQIALGSVVDMEGFYQHLEKMLVDIHFLNLARPRQLMSKLRRFFNRAHPDQTELNILRGILKAIASRLQ